MEMKMIFNDRMFEDGWAEPYLVTLHFERLHMTEAKCPNMMAEEIQKHINEMVYNEGFDCSEDGINQILEKFKTYEPRLTSWNIEFIPGVCFGTNEFELS